jgi:hypothetical protein
MREATDCRLGANYVLSAGTFSVTSRSLTRPSRDPEPATNMRPFGGKASELRLAPPSPYVARSREMPPISKRRPSPSRPAEANSGRSGLNATVTTPLVCAYKVATGLAVLVGGAGLAEWLRGSIGHHLEFESLRKMEHA